MGHNTPQNYQIMGLIIAKFDPTNPLVFAAAKAILEGVFIFCQGF
jgi:hypothetical protein